MTRTIHPSGSWLRLALAAASLVVLSQPPSASAQPYGQSAKLVPVGAEPADGFGHSVSASQDRLLIGAVNAGGNDAGAAYVFERNLQGDWTLAKELIASDAGASDYFGAAVSISGDVALVGAPNDNPGGSDSGSAYVYERDAQTGVWIQRQKLVASDADEGDRFGWSLAISNDVAFIGAPQEGDPGGSTTGAVYFFERDTQTELWTQVQKLRLSDVWSSHHFGTSVTLAGDTALVGAEWSPPGGAAYVFVRSDQTGEWIETQKLDASDAAGSDYFGYSGSMSGNVLLIGAYGDDDAGDRTGSAYVFERDQQSGAWSETQKLLANDASEGARFGYSVSVSGSAAFIGAYGTDDDGDASGSVYVFERDGGTGAWEERQKLIASDASGGDWFGYSVSATDSFILVGATGDDDGALNAGAAYVFEATVPPAVEPGLTGNRAAVEVVGPNPFRSQTTLVLTLTRPGLIRLTLHDPLGREVALLAAGWLPAGRHEVPLAAEPLPSSVYVWRLQTPDGAETGQVTRIR